MSFCHMEHLLFIVLFTVIITPYNSVNLVIYTIACSLQTHLYLVCCLPENVHNAVFRDTYSAGSRDIFAAAHSQPSYNV